MIYYGTNKPFYKSYEKGFKYPDAHRMFTTTYYWNKAFCINTSKTPPEILEEIKSKLSTTIGKTLYFTKESKYPRFRLQGTAYKRTIKEDKADTIVIPTPNYDDFNKFVFYTDTPKDDSNLYEGKDGFYIITKECRDFFPSEEKMLAYIEQKGIKLKYVDKLKNLFYFTKSIFPLIDFYLGKYNKPVITDEMLNIEISKSYPVITEQDVDSIDSMLQSTDYAIRELGLKMLAGFNVFATPNLIKVLIYKNYQNLLTIINKGGVEIDRLINSVDCTRGYISAFPGWLDLIIRDSKDTITEYEREQIKRIVKGIYEQILNNQIERAKDTLDKLKLNVKVVVE